MDLRTLGWTEALATAFADLGQGAWVPGRVVRIERGVAHAITADGECAARIGGRLHGTDGSGGPPVVGDWIAIAPGEGGRIEPLARARLPRRTRFARQAAGRTSEEQVLVANIDVLFVVCGLDGDFNPRRIERYLALARSGGIEPVVLLNKVDLCDDLDGMLGAARAAAPETPVVVLGARDGTGVDALAPWLEAGTTVALVGSSGVGKSTLVNRFLGEDRIATAEVRASDDRGRHTTTRRELFVLPGGALCIDTPGLRELQIAADEDEIGTAFPEIEALAADCRFRDCGHGDEPGCAVREAALQGDIDAGRIDAWRRLVDEAEAEALRRDARASRADARRIGRMYKRILSDKKKTRR